MAGGGIKGGQTIGETDDFSYNVVRDPVSVYDLNATILHCLGIDHTRLTYKFQGRYFRLTDVHGEADSTCAGLTRKQGYRRVILDPTVFRRSRLPCSHSVSSWRFVRYPSLLLLPPALRSSTARLTGVVTDSGGAVLPNAIVKVTNVETAQEASVSTNDVGGYTLSNLAPGTYDIAVQSTGFRTLTRRGVSITANTLRREDVTLELGQVSESVTVNAGVICSANRYSRCACGTEHEGRDQHAASEVSQLPDPGESGSGRHAGAISEFRAGRSRDGLCPPMSTA